MIAQYTQSMGVNTQPPVQNIINTTGNNSDTDIRYVKPNEDISNIIDMVGDRELEKVEEKLYEIAEGRVLTEDKAREIIECMEPYGKK